MYRSFQEYWSSNASTLTASIILLLEQIVSAVDCEFRANLVHLIPLMLQVFGEDGRPERTISIRLLKAMQVFGKSLEEYLHFLLPPVIAIFDDGSVSQHARRVALETVEVMTHHLDLTDFSSRILHALVRLLGASTPRLRQPAMELLASLALQLNQRFEPYARLVLPILEKNKISHKRFEMIYHHINKVCSSLLIKC